MKLFIGLIIGLAFGGYVFRLQIEHHAYKLMYDLPWMKWLTIDEIGSMGFSKLFSRLLLPTFHEKGYLELRPRGSLTGSQLEIAKTLIRFPNPGTMKLYEFRLIKRGGPRKKKGKERFSLFPGFDPVPQTL